MVDYIAAVANHPSQFKYNGRVLVTTFSGESCGDGAWVDLRNRLNSKGIQVSNQNRTADQTNKRL